jgi:hypothetical protein
MVCGIYENRAHILGFKIDKIEVQISL